MCGSREGGAASGSTSSVGPGRGEESTLSPLRGERSNTAPPLEYQEKFLANNTLGTRSRPGLRWAAKRGEGKCTRYRNGTKRGFHTHLRETIHTTSLGHFTLCGAWCRLGCIETGRLPSDYFLVPATSPGKALLGRNPYALVWVQLPPRITPLSFISCSCALLSCSDCDCNTDSAEAHNKILHPRVADSS